MSIFDLYRRTGRTTRMLENIKKELLLGKNVVLYINQGIEGWLNKEFPNYKYNNISKDVIFFGSEFGRLQLRNRVDEYYHSDYDHYKGSNTVIFIDHYLLEESYGYAIETWLKQNNQI